MHTIYMTVPQIIMYLLTQLWGTKPKMYTHNGGVSIGCMNRMGRQTEQWDENTVWWVWLLKSHSSCTFNYKWLQTEITIQSINKITKQHNKLITLKTMDPKWLLHYLFILFPKPIISKIELQLLAQSDSSNHPSISLFEENNGFQLKKAKPLYENKTE